MKQAETEVVMGDEQPRDRKGRRRLTRERRAEVVKEYEASGLTQAEFARRAGLNQTTFSHWVQRSADASVAAFRLMRELRAVGRSLARERPVWRQWSPAAAQLALAELRSIAGFVDEVRARALATSEPRPLDPSAN